MHGWGSRLIPNKNGLRERGRRSRVRTQENSTDNKVISHGYLSCSNENDKKVAAADTHALLYIYPSRVLNALGVQGN